MRIRLTRHTAILLMVLLFPVVAVGRVVRALRGRKNPALRNSIDGDPFAHIGDTPVLIALWADWAHIWVAATRGMVEQLQREFAGRCEFTYVDASAASVRTAYGVAVVPTLILRHRGAEIARFPNALKVEDVRSAIDRAIS